MELVCRGFQLLTFQDDMGPNNMNFSFIQSSISAAWVTHWDTENGKDGRECYIGAVKTDPFYRLGKKRP